MDRIIFKQALNELDSPQRTAMLYLEKLILEKKTAPITTQVKPDLSQIHVKIDGLSKKVDNVETYRKEFKDMNKKIYETQSLFESYKTESENIRDIIQGVYDAIIKLMVDNKLGWERKAGDADEFVLDVTGEGKMSRELQRQDRRSRPSVYVDSKVGVK